nr:flagellar FliJ family protein [uncultured Eisenbergiella sp.]
MKKFIFPLERMLNFQEQDLEKERGVMSRLLAYRTQLEEKRRLLSAEMERVQKERETAIRKGTTVFELRSSGVLLVSGKKQLEELRNESLRIEEEIEKQRQVVVSASQEVKKLENLKDKQLEEYRQEEAREQQEMISEHVSGSFVRNGVSYR